MRFVSFVLLLLTSQALATSISINLSPGCDGAQFMPIIGLYSQPGCPAPADEADTLVVYSPCDDSCAGPWVIRTDVNTTQQIWTRTIVSNYVHAFIRFFIDGNCNTATPIINGTNYIDVPYYLPPQCFSVPNEGTLPTIKSYTIVAGADTVTASAAVVLLLAFIATMLTQQ